MKPELLGRSGPDYALCRYGLSRVAFRGPAKSLEGMYVAFLGGTETFGKFLDHPFVERTEDAIGITCVNFGCVNAGLDLFSRDATLLAACHDAVATVIQLSGVQNQSNRFYSVHPRRNDRFLRPSAALETLYPEIDFADFAFTRHLLLALEQCSRDRFALIRSELQFHWIERMRWLIRHVTGPTVLLWLGENIPPDTADTQNVMHDDPLFVTRSMVDTVSEGADHLVEVVPPKQHPVDRCDGMRFHPLERPAAQELLGSAAHAQVVKSLVPVLDDIILPTDV